MMEGLSLLDSSTDPVVVKRVYDHIRYRQKTIFKKTLAAIEATTKEERVSQ